MFIGFGHMDKLNHLSSIEIQQMPTLYESIYIYINGINMKDLFNNF